MLNDIYRNEENIRKGKLTMIGGIKECDAFWFDASGDNILPRRNYIFGKEENKRSHNLALFTVSDYDKDKNIYVTLKPEKDAHDKGARLVWLQPE